jgi:hypothetical protein
MEHPADRPEPARQIIDQERKVVALRKAEEARQNAKATKEKMKP